MVIATAVIAGVALFGVRSAQEAATTVQPSPTAPVTAGSFDSEDPEDFVDQFRKAIDRGDLGLLADRLHPIVLAIYGEEACLAHIEQEVLNVENYVQVGPVEGPTTRTFDTPSGTTSAITYTAEVVFDFGGQVFDDKALYGPVDGLMHWFTECAI